MTNKSNGNGNSNGHDPDHNGEKEKIVKFPTLAERDRIRKKQQAEENAYRKSYRKQNEEPFFNFGNIPPFTKIIIGVFIAIHAITALTLDASSRLKIISDFGFVPSKFLGGQGWDALSLITPITYNFLHGDWTHLGFNVLMGLALGTFVERMFSTPTTIKFFFLCGIGGAVVFYLLNIGADTPVIGASGAISGLFAASILMMYEQGRMGRLTGRLANKGPWPLIFIWAGIMAFIGIAFGGVAWEAHLGGFLTGAGLYRLMRTGKLRL